MLRVSLRYYLGVRPMRAILYCPDDFELVAETGAYLCHLAECDDCQAKLLTDASARVNLSRILEALGAVTLAPLDGDLEQALGVCCSWMRLHHVMSEIAMGADHATKH